MLPPEIASLTMKQLYDSGIFLKVKSDLVGEVIGLAANDTVANRYATPGMVIYTATEMSKILKGNLEPEEIKAMHLLKKSMSAYILEVKPNVKGGETKPNEQGIPGA